jgi:hypothetical protein
MDVEPLNDDSHGTPKRRTAVHRLSGSVALRVMVAGHYQPLADGGAKPRDLTRATRPNLSSAVESEDKDKQVDMGPGFPFSTAPLSASLVFGL